MFGLGWPEVLVILFVLLVIFGSKKIPEIGGALGKTVKGLKEELNEDQPEQLDEDQR